MEGRYAELYDVFTNLFRFVIDNLGISYYIGSCLDESIDYAKVIRRGGHFYSYEEEYGTPYELTESILLGFIRKKFNQTVKENDYKYKGKYRLYKEEDKIRHNNEDVFNLFKGFRHRVISINNEYYLCIDPTCVILTTASIEDLVIKGIKLKLLRGYSVRFLHEDGFRISGYLLDTTRKNGNNFCIVRPYRPREDLDLSDIVEIKASSVFPESRPEVLESILNKIGSSSSIVRLVRRHSFLDSKTPSRDRIVETLKIVEKLDENIFPLNFGDFQVSLNKEPLIVKRWWICRILRVPS